MYGGGKNNHVLFPRYFFSVITVITRIVIVLYDLGDATWLRREKTATSISSNRVKGLIFFCETTGRRTCIKRAFEKETIFTYSAFVHNDRSLYNTAQVICRSCIMFTTITKYIIRTT